jgi:phosphoribosylamine--glycine ligase
MGAFSPSVLVTPELAARIEREVVRPVLRGMAAEGMPFTGFLYCGLMLTPDGPKVIEFNCRFGDPEAQVVLPLLAEPLAPVLARAATGQPLPAALRFSGQVAVGVVLASGGYPGALDTGHEIHGLDLVGRECPGVSLRYAGVSARDTALVASGGRVLTVVARATTYPAAITAAYDAVSRIQFQGMQYRTDIGARAVATSTP